jgi:hypothetical protein
MTNFWKRFIDKRGGGTESAPPMKSEETKKRWYKKYFRCIYFLVLIHLIVLYFVVMALVNGVPTPDEMKTYEVHILEVHERDPHLHVQMPDGSKKDMEYPVKITKGGGYSFNGISAKEQARLTGCHAVVRGVPIRWTFINRFRVWELSCPKKNIYLSFERSVKAFGKGGYNNFSLISGAVAYSIGLLIGLLIFIWDKKGVGYERDSF